MRKPLIVIATLLLTAPTFAEEFTGRIDPTTTRPSEALKKAGRSLAALENYHLTYDLQIGLVATGSTRIESPAVQKTFSGPVNRGILSIPEERIFLSTRGGAAPDPNTGVYRAVDMHTAARQIALILELPHEHIALPLKAGRNAQWIPGTTTIEVTLPSAISQKNLKTIQNAGCTGATEDSVGVLARIAQRKSNTVYRIDLDMETGLPTRIQIVTTCGLQFECGEELRYEMIYDLSSFGCASHIDIPREATRYLR